MFRSNSLKVLPVDLSSHVSRDAPVCAPFFIPSFLHFFTPLPLHSFIPSLLHFFTLSFHHSPVLSLFHFLHFLFSLTLFLYHPLTSPLTNLPLRWPTNHHPSTQPFLTYQQPQAVAGEGEGEEGGWREHRKEPVCVSFSSNNFSFLSLSKDSLKNWNW